MTLLSFTIEVEDFDTLSVEDMGDDTLVLSQVVESGKRATIAVSRDQLLKALDATTWRYSETKNTDRQEAYQQSHGRL